MFNCMSNCYRIGLAVVLIIGISTTAVSAVQISYFFENDSLDEYTDVHFDYRVPVTFIAADIKHDVPNAESYITNMDTFLIIALDKEAEIYEERINASDVFGFRQFSFIEIESGFELSLEADYAKWERDFHTNITFYSLSDEVLVVQNWNINDNTYNLTSDIGGYLAVYCDCFYKSNITAIEPIFTNGLSWMIVILPMIAMLWRQKYAQKNN